MKKILTVDDIAFYRDKIKNFFGNLGHEVDEAEDGMEAIKKAENYEYNLVITDQNMPQMNGIKLIAELRKLPQYKNTTIVMLTSERSNELRQKAMAAGADFFVNKPMNLDFLQKLNEQL